MRFAIALAFLLLPALAAAAGCKAESGASTAALVESSIPRRAAAAARPNEAIDLQARAELADPALAADAALYLAVYENRLMSRITAGENSGRTLTHDQVVLEWQGPFAFGPTGRASERRPLKLLPKGAPERSGAVGFVQDRRTGEVLQALLLSSC